jgi:hypothetical protein
MYGSCVRSIDAFPANRRGVKVAVIPDNRQTGTSLAERREREAILASQPVILITGASPGIEQAQLAKSGLNIQHSFFFYREA